MRPEPALSNASSLLGSWLAGSLAEKSIPKCFRNGKTAVKFRAWPETCGVLRQSQHQKCSTSEKASLCLALIPSCECLGTHAWLLWHDQKLTGRAGDLCSALCTSQLPASHLFGGGAKLSGKTLTQALHGNAKMAFELAGKGCLKPLSNACGHLSERRVAG